MTDRELRHLRTELASLADVLAPGAVKNRFDRILVARKLVSQLREWVRELELADVERHANGDPVTQADWERACS